MTNDMLSQEEIDALLKGDSSNEPEIEFYEDEIEDSLSEIEIDALGEIGNISMGTAATTLSTLLNKKVNITTPRVAITNSDELANDYKLPFVAIDVSYKEGLEGSNILILNTKDTKVITDLMMGKDDFDIERDLTELDLSAVSEAMNQMMGSSATSLSEMFMRKIDIEPPRAVEITFAEGRNQIELLRSSLPIIKISFRIVVGDLIDSNIMQLVPIDFGKNMVATLMGSSVDSNTEFQGEDEEIPTLDMDIIAQAEAVQEDFLKEKQSSTSQAMDLDHGTTKNSVNMNQMDTHIESNTNIRQEEKVTVKKPDFQSFDTVSNIPHSGSIDLIGDIPVEITVELGRTHRKISDILEFGQGTVVELDKLVGEPLNIYANGRFIAKGEVVVIDDNFGVRVTEIQSSNQKII